MSFGTVQAEKMTTESGYSLGAGNASSFKNRIINGGMEINQYDRGTFNISNGGALSYDYPADRFSFYKDQTGATVAASNSSTAPTGFTNSVLWSVTTGASAGTLDQCFIAQSIEGYNWADLAWGTANAKSVIFSFWVNTSVTGTYGVSFSNSAANQVFVGTYTVNAANTWEQKTIAITGSTSGTWLTTNGIGLRIRFDMGSGTSFETATPNTWQGSYDSTVSGRANLTGTTGATFYLTGVQMEVGTVVTSFDWRPYNTELYLCQRYLPALSSSGSQEIIGPAYAPNSTTAQFQFYHWAPPRVPPTGIVATAGSTFTYYSGTATFVGSAIAWTGSGIKSSSMNLTVSGVTAGAGAVVWFNSISGKVLFTGCEI
jgi:hypothetical protein